MLSQEQFHQWSEATFEDHTDDEMAAQMRAILLAAASLCSEEADAERFIEAAGPEEEVLVL